MALNRLKSRNWGSRVWREKWATLMLTSWNKRLRCRWISNDNNNNDHICRRLFARQVLQPSWQHSAKQRNGKTGLTCWPLLTWKSCPRFVGASWPNISVSILASFWATWIRSWLKRSRTFDLLLLFQWCGVTFPFSFDSQQFVDDQRPEKDTLPNFYLCANFWTIGRFSG